MGCLGRRLVLLALACQIAAGSAYDECFPRASLYEFWLSPLYVPQNSHILHLGFADFYYFEFDAASEGLNLSGLSLASGTDLLSSLPKEERGDFAALAQAMDSAANATKAAGESHLRARTLSRSAQGALAGMLSPFEYALLLSPLASHPGGVARILLPVWHAYEIGAYGASYPSHLWEAHRQAASAFDSAAFAQNELAKKIDAKLEYLSRAGVGSPEYNGRARQAYSRAQSALSESAGRCGAKSVKRVSEYFASSPELPDLSSCGLSDYLQDSIGIGNGSGTAFLALTYSSLHQAVLQMQQEYDSEHFSAQSSSDRLAYEISLLEKEKLELIGEQPPSSPSEHATVGFGFSGILSGLRKAKEELSSSRQLLSEAESLAATRKADNYLALAISKAASSGKKSGSALGALPEVRSNAYLAVEAQKGAAQEAILQAKKKLSASIASFSDAEALEASGELLESAELKFSGAESENSLGGRFRGYSEALGLAAEAMARADLRAFTPARSQSEQALYSLESLIAKASKDGLELEYEQGNLRSYRQLLRSSTQPSTFDAVASAAAEDYSAILLRWSEQHSPLYEKYREIRQIVSEVRKSEQSFLPSFDSLGQYFGEGGLDAKRAAGNIDAIKKELDLLHAQSQSALPVHLSSMISKSALVQEISDQPVLGKQSRYSATIIAGNPSSLSYSGRISIAAMTSVPLYSADFTSGDRISDAYFKDGATSIIIQGATPLQQFSFGAQKLELPASVSSSEDICGLAYAKGAAVRRAISFFATREMESLGILEPVPEGTEGGSAQHAGKSHPLASAFSGGEPALSGTISGVPDGRGEVILDFEVASPFEQILSEPRQEALGSGRTKVTYTVTLENPRIDCDSAAVEIDEPYAGVSEFSAVPLGPEKISSPRAVPTGAGTRLSFLLSPLKKGRRAQASVSYLLVDASAAASQALALAEAQATSFKRPKDAYTLSQARALLSQNRTGEALSLLAAMLKEGESLALSHADREQFLQENRTASGMLAEIEGASAFLLRENLSSQSARLSQLSSALQGALSSAALLWSDGKYPEATKLVRKAASQAASSLSELAYDSSLQTSKLYAAARKEQVAASPLLSDAESLLSAANSIYSEGSHLQSYLYSSRAQGAIGKSAQQALSEGQSARQALQNISSEFDHRKAGAEKSLADYSQQYSSLAGQSKKRLPITPAAAQQKLDDASKGMAAALKAGTDAREALLQANRSLLKLDEAAAAIEDSLSSIRRSAASSLQVALVALSEARAKSSQEDANDLSAIESEAIKAQDFLENSHYADSLMASERAIAASNSLLSKKAAAIDAPTAALGAISVLLIAAAAYYLSKGKKEAEKKGSKKKIPKGEGA